MNIIFAFVACFVGIVISLYLFTKKLAHKHLACPRQAPCDAVVHSRFSKTLGIPNEMLGIIYFLSVATILLIPASGLTTSWLLYCLFFLLIAGGLFSLYLIAIQVFVIRTLCAWCIAIAITNMVLIYNLSSFPINLLTNILASQKLLWVVIHNIGFILGIGAATITDVLFFRFLKDNQISAEEKGTMDTLTNVIWVGLVILIISGLALFLPQANVLAVSSKFLLKTVVVGVILVNGVLLNMFVAPRMRRLSFAGDNPSKRFRRLAFALGGISLTSWYLAFLLGSLRSISFNFYNAVLLYGLLLVCVIVASQIAERRIAKGHQSQT